MADLHFQRFVVVSGYHDYRSKRRANLHFIADQLARRGEVFFLSLRYSRLTRHRDDPRHDLWDRANRIERVQGVDCYLWRTPIHPFRMPPPMRWVERALFGIFARTLPRAARDAVARATHIYVESGVGIIYLPLIRRLNPGATVVYMASDALGAVGQADTIKRAFQRHAALVDFARIPSPYLRDDIPASIPCLFIPHGIERHRFAATRPSPFGPGTVNAVSVGSMLFDPQFFAVAGPLFPDVTFHVIGSGFTGPSPSNVVLLPEMPFQQTLPYLQHADFAVAAYGRGVERYLTHTSMKLTQFAHLGLPAVCPSTVVGGHPLRFGYQAGEPDSIARAVRAARANPTSDAVEALDWDEVCERLLRGTGASAARKAEAASRTTRPPRPAGLDLRTAQRASE